MHEEHSGFAQSPAVALGYLVVAFTLFGCKYSTAMPKPVEHPHHGGPIAEPAK